LVLKVSVVGTAGKETAAPLASVPENPVGNVMPPDVAMTRVDAVAVF
jgi:alanine-alpha-ketoisovalerate/valine-pyruvate aminotransferase